jgi:aminoglycoside phosphotransferase (APT) family kinase protein
MTYNRPYELSGRRWPSTAGSDSSVGPWRTFTALRSEPRAVPREERLDEPTTVAVRDTVADSLDRRVRAVRPLSRGVNALYRVALADGNRAVLKTPRYATDAEFLAEPAVLSRIGRETGVPVPEIITTGGADDGTLDRAYYLMEFLDGRQVEGVVALSATARERFAREAAAHLAAVHELRIGEAYGPLEYAGGDVRPEPSFASWTALFDDLAADVTAGLRGDGPLTDERPRFADLEPAVSDALTGLPGDVVDPSPRPALVVRDYRPVNVVLASDDDADPLVRGVFDVSGLVGDPLLDAAKTEAALVDVPLGGTAEGESLRTAFRTAYAERRGVGREDLFDERYPCYRLYALAYRLKAFDYSVQFARETDPDAVARRWRSSVERRLDEISATR